MIYSDGVTETTNPDDEEFGIDRLGQTIKRHLDRTAAGLRDRIEAAVTEFADGTAAVLAPGEELETTATATILEGIE